MYVAEIFKSIHGEVNGHHQGRKVGFIRVSDCNLKCWYCDTPETQNAMYGKDMTISEVVKEVINLGVQYVCITGGEPLLQDSDFAQLVYELKMVGMKVSVETNGTMDILPYMCDVESFVVDYKIEYLYKMKPSNYTILRNSDVVKFVVSNKAEFDYACRKMRDFRSEGSHAVFAVSPVVSYLPPEQLAQFILESTEDNIVLSLQIHKMLKIK